MPPATPAFSSPAWLLSHAQEQLDWFARPACIDAVHGGLFHSFFDDGSVADANVRHLVSATRLVVQFSHGCIRFPSRRAVYEPLLRSCLAFLRARHRDAATGGYAWTLGVEDGCRDGTNYTYGLAFALLAYASALRAGVAEARAWIDETFDVLTARMWEPSEALYADEASADWSVRSPYRGQNANMHACEAHLGAFLATREARHLARARAIARAMCVRQAGRVAAATGGRALVYEHYSAAWQPDFAYHADKPDDRFKPWGCQSGHLFEWAKLLLQLQRVGGALGDGEAALRESAEERGWRVPTARAFFAAALEGWDARGGGFAYSMASAAMFALAGVATPAEGAGATPQPPAPDALILCNRRRYKWVLCEGAAAAALLADALPAERAHYERWYARIWDFTWQHMVDHVHGERPAREERGRCASAAGCSAAGGHVRAR